MKTKKKKYFLNAIEEAVLNPDFFGYRGERIEVYDNSSPYPIYL